MSTIAVRGGKIVTMGPQSTIEDGVMVIEEGRISEVGSGDSVDIPSKADSLDFSDRWIFPGMIDSHTHVGIFGEGEGWAGEDTNEMTEPTTPQVRGLDGINPAGLGLQDAVVGGVTTVNVGPGSANVIGGEFVAIKTSGSMILDQLVVRSPSAMKMATGENPKRVYGEKDSMPSTRIGTAAVLREKLFEAKDYMERKRRGKEEKFTKEFIKESLIPVLKGELRAKIHAHRADDIVTAIRVAEEFNLRYSIDHCTEGHKIADFLADKGAEVVVGPGLTGRSKREVIERTFKTPGILSEAGIRVAITTDSPVIPIQYLPLMAAFAVREGMDEFQALKAITIDSARLADIDDRVGSLEEGKDGDFIVCNGSPLKLQNRVENVFINGNQIDLDGLPQLGKPHTF